MASNENKYRLNQDNKEYILTVGVEGKAFKLSCQDSKINDAENFTKYYSLENLREYDGFNSVSSLEDATNAFDKMLGTEKISIDEAEGKLKVCVFKSDRDPMEFVLVPEVNAGAVQAPLQDPSKLKQNPPVLPNQINQQFQQNLYQPDSFKQNTQGIYEAPTIIHPTQVLEPIVKGYNATSGVPLSQYNQTYGTDFSSGIMTSVVDLPTTTYYDNNYGFNSEIYGTTSYDANQYITGQYGETNYGTYDLNQLTQQGNILNDKYLNPINGTVSHVNFVNQPIYEQPIVEGQKLQGVPQSLQQPQPQPQTKIDAASYITNNVNNQYTIPNPVPEVKSTPVRQNVPVPQPVPNATPSLNEQKLQTENEGLKNELEKLVAQVNQYKLQVQSLSEEKQRLLSAPQQPVAAAQATEADKDAGALKAENDALKAQLGELNVLRRKVAEMEVLRGQLVELNQLRAKLAELNSLGLQVGEIEQLRKQAAENNALRNQLAQLGTLRGGQSPETENLRLRVEQLEGIKMQYEQELTQMREMLKQRDNQNYVSNLTGGETKETRYERTVEQVAVKGDIIHNAEEIGMLTKKINKQNQRLTLNLLYKASVDSDKAAAFHEKCDGAQSSLVLVETKKGLRFGGFTTCSWSGDCVDKKDEEAFVFSLDKMTTYDNIPGEDAVGCYPKFGPIFLGCQIRIYDDAFTKGGTTFEKGLNYNTEEDFELNGGERVFDVKEIEVYEVIPQ